MVKQEYDNESGEGWIADQLNRPVGYLERPDRQEFHLYINKNGVGVWLTEEQLLQLKALIDEYCEENGLDRAK